MTVIYRIAREDEAHTIGEKLVKPCAVDLAACVTDEEAAREIQLMPLSDNMIQRRIEDCAANVLDEFV
jgi:hypothetical protein